MLRIPSKHVLRLAPAANLNFSSVDTLPPSFRNYVHIAVLAGAAAPAHGLGSPRTARSLGVGGTSGMNADHIQRWYSRSYLHVAALARAVRPAAHGRGSYRALGAGRESGMILAHGSEGRAPWLFTSNVQLARTFHATRRNEGFPLAVLLGTLKSSVFINILQVGIRVALTLLPVALVKKHISHKWLRKLDRYPNKFPELESERPRILRHIRANVIFLKVLVLVPATLFGLVVLASVERTPLTGRLRLIVLSADEEEGIASDLAGPGWFTAVSDLLTTPRGPPTFIPPTDWRYAWVERILRRLESVVPVLQNQSSSETTDWLERGSTDPPYPPPPEYPLLPRPRVSQQLHYFDVPNAESEHRRGHMAGDAPPHTVLGPPYSLLVTHQPDQSNAFSYGFGPKGSGGVVIFSGFLDEILRQTDSSAPTSAQPRSRSLLSFLNQLFSPSQPPAHPIPTPEQDAQLATLVAHELAHLLLSHHLETLSSASIFWPSLISIITDLFRAVLFPVTMVGGPFLNDALEQVGEIGKREFTTAADSCSSHKMEIEADIVSIRLLALAGWDARTAVEFWESRINAPLSQEMRDQAVQTQLPGVLPGALWVSQDGGVHSSSHPVDAVRVKKVREELERWEVERRRTLQKMASQR